MKKSLKLFFVLFFFLFSAGYADTTESGFYVQAAKGPCTVYDASNKVVFQGDGQKLEGESILTGQKVETGREATLILLHYPDMSRVTVDQNSIFKAQTQSSIWLSLGKVWVKVEKFLSQPSNFEVESPNAVAVAHGTQFQVTQDESGSDVHVFEGSVQVNNGTGSSLLKPGSFVSNIKKGATLAPQAFNMQNISNPWWKWNLSKEEKFSNFLKTHRTAMLRLANQRGIGTKERMTKIRSFMQQRGFPRRMMINRYERLEKDSVIRPEKSPNTMAPGRREKSALPRHLPRQHPVPTKPGGTYPGFRRNRPENAPIMRNQVRSKEPTMVRPEERGQIRERNQRRVNEKKNRRKQR